MSACYQVGMTREPCPIQSVSHFTSCRVLFARPTCRFIGMTHGFINVDVTYINNCFCRVCISTSCGSSDALRVPPAETRLTVYSQIQVRRGGGKDTRLGPTLYVLLASSFVTGSGYMCLFGLRFCLGRFVVMLKPMVATALKVIAGIKIVGGFKVRHICWNMTFHEQY